MVKRYYCQPIAERFKDCLKLRESEAHRRHPAKKLPRAAERREDKLRHARLSGFPIGRMPLPTTSLPVAPAGDPRRSNGGKRVRHHAHTSAQCVVSDISGDVQVS
jgi:hypothetical protein